MTNVSHGFRMGGEPILITDEYQVASQRKREMQGAFAALGEVVYFVRREHLIKIGYSTRLRERLWEIAAKPSDLLLILPGGRELERGMHARFADLRAEGDGLGVEHFHPAPDLLAYINEHREAMNLPALAA